MAVVVITSANENLTAFSSRLFRLRRSPRSLAAKHDRAYGANEILHQRRAKQRRNGICKSSPEAIELFQMQAWKPGNNLEDGGKHLMADLPCIVERLGPASASGNPMITAIGVALTVVFVTASLVGTSASGWLLGEALSPARAGTIIGPLTLGMLLALLAAVFEGTRLAISLLGERIWRRSHFQGSAFAIPLWLACTAYCILMPLLALAFVPLLPASSHMLTVIAPAWAAMQIAAGLLPGITWSGAEPAVEAETERREAGSDLREAPAHLVAQPAASAESVDDFLKFLSRLSELPAGSKLPRRGRIGTNHEILISQAGLAALVGRSKPTVRRWLQELERGERITKRLAGKDTCILLQPQMPKPNGDARVLNGEAHA